MIEDRREYQRYALNETTSSQFDIIVEGEPVRLLDFSLGGLHILSRVPFSPGGISFSVNLGNLGKIELIGTGDRVKKEGDMWEIAIDLTKTYNLNVLRAL